MANEAIFVFGVIAVAAALMASGKLRFDIVSLLVLLSLVLSGILTVDEALSGFGSQVVALVAGLLVVGEMLSRTGVARVVGDWVMKHGKQSETRLLALIMICAALLGSVMSSTVVVALFIPVVLRIAAQTQLNASRMLIPLSYASLISGMLTLIATTPNIVVNQALKGAGFQGFGFFSFSPVGVAVLAVAILYILLVGRRLLGSQTALETNTRRGSTLEELWRLHSPNTNYQKLEILTDSGLNGQTIADAKLDSHYRVRIIAIEKDNEYIVAPDANTVLAEGMVLLCVGKPESIERLLSELPVRAIAPIRRDREYWRWEISGATVLIHPDSEILGKSLRDSEFRSRYGIHVLGMRRNFQAIEDFENTSLQSADSLFVVGRWNKIQQLSQKSHDFVVTEYPREHIDMVPSYKQIRIALLILGGMVGLALFNVVPLIVAVMMASLAAIFTGCMTMEDAYRSIHWSALVLLAGMLPLAAALDKTGGTAAVVDLLMSASSDAGPYFLMTLVFFLTAGIGLILSNTTAAVLVAPIAIHAAMAIGISPYPMAVAVLIAASSSFSTPVATPVVTLVVEPGRYRFFDFVKVGVPLLMLSYLTTIAIAPLVFPFFP